MILKHKAVKREAPLLQLINGLYDLFFHLEVSSARNASDYDILRRQNLERNSNLNASNIFINEFDILGVRFGIHHALYNLHFFPNLSSSTL